MREEETYGLSWPGKAQSILDSQSLVSGELHLCEEDSLYPDTTRNLIIEGDNIDVLKLLQLGTGL